MKSYREFCSVAKTLDVIGDRWALLVVRELLPGPRRYTDLLDGLPGIGTNVLSTRLRELEDGGIVRRRRLPPPAAVTVYELTDDGRDLQEVVQALSRWGMRRLDRPAKDEHVEPRWLVGTLLSITDASGLADGNSFELHVDGEDFKLVVDGGALTFGDQRDRAAATLTTSVQDLFDVVKGDRSATQRIGVEGDRAAARKLVRAIIGAGATP